MSFLRTFRSNLILSTAPPESKTGSMKASAAPNGPGAGRRNSSQHEERVASGTTRRSSGTGLSGRNGGRHSGADGGRYGKENPAPIVVYLDKPGQEAKKPASILRTNTFTTSKSKPADHSPEPEQIRYATAAITRSDTFTIDEPDDVSGTGHTGTYTRRGTMDVFEPLYVKNIELDSHELPVIVDSRTYRKKSRSTSKPVQKVESFIKRFERTLFNKHGANERRKQSVGSARKNSTSAAGAADAGPRFRDVGINCKLDEEDRFRAKVEAMRKVRQGSRDSITSALSTVARRERSQSPSKRYTMSHDRRSSSASSFALAPLEELSNQRTPSPPYGGTTIPLAVDRPTESSFLKSRQKEIEMGYSVVNKRQQPLTLPVGERRSPERVGPHSTIASRSRPASYAEEDVRPVSTREQHYSTYVIARNAATSREDKGPRFRSDTYRTLKEEYEQQQVHQQAQQLATKPIGIASPLCGSEGSSSKGPAPLAPSKDAAGDLPKYTFGTDLQQRRTRFQQFQRSFKKMDDSASEVSVQQSFFVPL